MVANSRGLATWFQVPKKPKHGTGIIREMMKLSTDPFKGGTNFPEMRSKKFRKYLLWFKIHYGIAPPFSILGI